MRAEKEKKVSIIHSFMDYYGGAEKIAVNFTSKLSERGLSMEFVTGKISDVWKNKLAKSKNKIVIKELGNSSRGPIFWMLANRYATRLKNLINKNSQLVMPHSFPGTLAAIKLKDELGIPCIWYCHDPTRILHEKTSVNWPLHHKMFFKIIRKKYVKMDINAVSKLDRIVANSKYTAKKIKNIYDFDERKIDIIYPGITINCRELNDRVPMVIKKAQSQGDKVIFCPSALSFHKNFLNILKACKLLQNIQFKAIFIGGRKEEIINFQRTIKKLGIEGKIIHLEKLSKKEMIRYYINSDLVVYVPINEPFGLIALEALLWKTPVVVSNIGGVSEIVKDEVTGLKVDPYNPLDIKKAIERILLDKERSIKMGEMGYKLVKTEFNIENSVDSLIKIIDETIAQS